MKPWVWVADAVGFEFGKAFDQRKGQFAQRQFAIGDVHAGQGVRRQHLSGIGIDALLQLRQPFYRKAETGGGGVSSVAEKKPILANGLKRLDEIELGDAAPGAVGDTVPDATDQRWMVMGFHDLRGCNPDHALMPAVGMVAGQDINRIILRLTGNPGFELFHQLPLNGLAFGIPGVNLLRPLPGLIHCETVKQLDDTHGRAFDAPGGIDARPQAEAKVASPDGTFLETCHFDERRQSRIFRAAVETAQPFRHDGPVGRAGERNEIGIGTDGDELGQGAEKSFSIRALTEQGTGHLPGQPAGGKVFFRVGVADLFRTHDDGICRNLAAQRRMVVNAHADDAVCACHFPFAVGSNANIHGHKHLNAISRRLLNNAGVESVAFLFPVGNVIGNEIIGLDAELLQHAAEGDQPGRAVAVIVSHNADALPAFHGPPDDVQGFCEVAHRARVGHVGQIRREKGRCLFGSRQSTVDETGGDERMNVQRLRQALHGVNRWGGLFPEGAAKGAARRMNGHGGPVLGWNGAPLRGDAAAQR
jgi:hypothetical protein